jgi:hypothetical protein
MEVHREEVREVWDRNRSVECLDTYYSVVNLHSALSLTYLLDVEIFIARRPV